MKTIAATQDDVGTYRLERLIGRGGTASVYAARRRGDGARVALKILSADLLDDPTAVPRFMREARIVSTLKSPHTVRVLEVNVSGGLPFLVMELLEGESLQSFLSRAPEQRLAIPVALNLISQALNAVIEAHNAGIVHRDLTLGNLFLTEERGAHHVKVLDFGLAKPLYRAETDPTAISLTQGGGCLGTPSFMAPEQILGGRDVDARTDIWALGVCLYMMITGHHPFDDPGTGRDASTLPMKILSGRPTPPATHRPGLPPRLSEILLRCLATRSADRYSSAEELLKEISAFASLATAQIKLDPTLKSINVEEPTPILEPLRMEPVRSEELTPVASIASLAAACGTRQSDESGFELSNNTVVMKSSLAKPRRSNPPPNAHSHSSAPPPPSSPAVTHPAEHATPRGFASRSAPPPPPLLPMRSTAPTVRVPRRSRGGLGAIVALSLLLLFILSAAFAFAWTTRPAARLPAARASSSR